MEMVVTSTSFSAVIPQPSSRVRQTISSSVLPVSHLDTVSKRTKISSWYPNDGNLHLAYPPHPTHMCQSASFDSILRATSGLSR